MTEDDFLLHVNEGDLYIQIPADFYKQMGIKEGDSLSLGIEKDRIILSKVSPIKKSS